MAKEFQFMDEETALQERPLGNYADALGKSYKDLEDRLRKEQSGGGFWSDLGKNFLNEAVVKPLATQATEAVSGLINDPFDENRKEFYEETEQKEAKRKYDSAYLSQAAHNKDEAARLSANKTEYEWELSSPRILQDFRTAFKTRAAEEGWDASAFTAEQIDGLTYEYRKSRAEKAAKVRIDMTKAGTRLKTKEDMVAYHETFNKRGRGIVGAVMNFIGRPVRGDFVDKAAKDFLESAALEDIADFQKLRKQYAETGNFDDMVGDVYGINISANNFGIAEEITTSIKVLNDELVKVKTIKRINRRTGITETTDKQIGGSLSPNKTALKSVPSIADIIKGYGFSNEATSKLKARLNAEFKSQNGKDPMNLQTPYQANDSSYTLKNYNTMVQRVVDHAADQVSFLDISKEKADELSKQYAVLLRDPTFLEAQTTLEEPMPSEFKSAELREAWEANRARAQLELATKLTAIERMSRINVGYRANQVDVQTIEGRITAVPKFHELVPKTDQQGKVVTQDINGDIRPVMVPQVKMLNGKPIATPEEIQDARDAFSLFRLERLSSSLSEVRDPLASVTARDLNESLSKTPPPSSVDITSDNNVNTVSQATTSMSSVLDSQKQQLIRQKESQNRTLNSLQNKIALTEKTLRNTTKPKERKKLQRTLANLSLQSDQLRNQGTVKKRYRQSVPSSTVRSLLATPRPDPDDDKDTVVGAFKSPANIDDAIASTIKRKK